MPQIGYSTKLLGVLGENISYTLSPAIHNYVFERLSIDAVYLAFDLKREKFRETIRG
ncbi:MAG: shikimate dehydrogenase, partial [Sulfolobales archaeon]|nr:shikimate dehydrogenase [Sulfolobales archaeon]